VQLAAAKDAADRALALDPNLPETHLALGYYRYYGQRDYTAGLAEFQQAEKGLPNNVDVIEAIGFIQRRLGHWDEAMVAWRRIIELDPRVSHAYNSLALTYTALRRFPEALATIDRALAWEPTNTGAVGVKASVFWATGDLQAVEPLLANPGTEPLVARQEHRRLYRTLRRFLRICPLVHVLFNLSGHTDLSRRVRH
jgi:tetratricopeptide (TPR) repeat protein